ncbi:type II toxin-antitoxin system RelE/ParE family toxin [Duganella sp. BuS-21]|uniref:type II toxin-antitoxin system RelE/ParE family toxin n=1 Tax=Duganella sp. BuS-21 TaxID=2943848 RepID=UPI0035A711E3
MSHIIWSDMALADLQRHFHFLAQHDKTLAARAVRAIRDAVRHLSANPRIGHQLLGPRPPRFMWPIKFGKSAYVIHYQLEEDDVIVLKVNHQRERR